MRLILFLPILAIISSCSKSNQFHKLDELTYENENVLHELYVMTAPAEDDLDSLASQVFYFIKSHSDGITKNYSSHFYRESRNMPRNYQEDHSFFSDVIADHLDDLIATVKIDKEGKWVLKVKTHNNPDQWKKYNVDKFK